MKTNYVLRKFTLTEKLKSSIEKKLKRLEKFFNDDTEVSITLTQERGREIVEITIFEKGIFYRAEETDGEALDALDRAVDVIERQIRKNKTKLEKRLRSGAFETTANGIEIEDEAKDFVVSKIKEFHCKPITVEEAILQMNLLGHQFYVFKNEETDSICVVYKKKNQEYGLIQPVE